MLAACPEAAEDTEITSGETEVITVNAQTDLTDLNQLTSIPGEPRQVWWLRSALGDRPGEGAPGPTDIMLEAVIDYGSADVVASLVGESSGAALQLESATWHPDALINAAEGEKLDVQQYLKVDGFDQSAGVNVPMAAPGFIIVRRLLGQP